VSDSPDNDPLRAVALARAAGTARAKLDAIRSARGTPAAAITYPAALEAAAVVSRYCTPDLDMIADSETAERVMSESIPVAGRAAQGDWSLLPEVRGAVLKHLASTNRLREALAHSEPIAPENDPLRNALTKLDGEGPQAFREMDVAELASVVPFIAYLHVAGPAFPSRHELDRRLEMLRLLEPFDRLAGGDFQGREDELRDLRIYVDVLESQGILESIQRTIASNQKKPMLIFGVGGVGKSTLLAKFLIDHARAAEWVRFPFAYLDFDRRAVMVDEPASILVEAIRQIGLQFDHAYEAAEELRRSWRTLLAASARRANVIQRADVRARDSIRRDFAGFVRKLEVDSGLPVLLVLDTFEEVQYRNRVYVETLGKFLRELATDIPRLRVVIVGRAEVPELDFDSEIELKEFKAADAVAFLRKSGIEDEELATAIVKQVGGNPLTLRLAAAVFRIEQEDADGGNSFFKLALVKGETIQGQLFARILRHVHDEDVKKIAHPGLVLRRVTPPIIRDVLAEPCNLDVPTPERAEQLFAELQREVSLVSPGDDPGVVKHRADVRKLMLPGLRDTEPVRVNAINRGAVAYYRQFDDAVSRAEEIYHLLCLEELAEAKERFRPDVSHHLFSAMDELRAPEKALLADLLGRDIPQAARATATLEIWERAAILRVDEYVRHGQYDAALKVFDEQSDRSTSTLLRVREAAIHAEQLNFELAATILAKALQEYTLAGNTQAIFETLLETAHVATFQGDSAAAATVLAQAETLARAHPEDIWLLRALTDPARGEIAVSTIDVIRETAHRIPDDRWTREAAVLRRVAAVVGGNDVDLVAKAASIAGGYALGAEDERRLSEALASTPDNLVGSSLGIWRRVNQAMTSNDPSRTILAAAVATVFANESHLSEPAAPQKAGPAGPKLKIDVDAMATLLEQSGIDAARLGDVLVRRFDRNLVSISFEKETHAVLAEVLGLAQSEGWGAALLDALRPLAPKASELLSQLDELGIGVRTEYVGGPAMREAALAAQRRAWRPVIGFIEQRICRIEVKGKFRGTGFLIAPALVLTAAPALERRDSEISVRFDYGAIGGKVYNEGVPCAAVGVPCAAVGVSLPGGDAGPQLLQLQRPIGDEPVGGARASRTAPVRRTFDPHAAAQFHPDSTLFWFWQTEKEGLHMAGTTEVTIGQEDLAMYANDRMRFAGGPCFNEDFRLVALHCGAHPARRRESRALPIAKVLELMRAANVEPLLGPRAIRLTGTELAELRRTLVRSFTLDDLRALLAEHLDVSFDEVVPPGQSLEVTVYMLLEHFLRTNSLGELIEAMAVTRPKSPEIDELRRRHLGR